MVYFFSRYQAFFLIVFILVPHLANADEWRVTPEGPIETDRPDFTESTSVVPRGWTQLENGITYVKDSYRTFDLSGSETLVRFGAFRQLEFRLGLPLYIHAHLEGREINGWGDTYLGFKYKLPNIDQWEFSLIPAVYAPWGSNSLSSKRWDPEVKFCFSRELGDWDLSGMAWGSLPTEEEGRNPTYTQTLSGSRGITENLAFFLEYAGSFPRDTTEQHLLHSGITYLLSYNILLDIHVAFGLNSAAPQELYAAGLSFRF